MRSRVKVHPVVDAPYLVAGTWVRIYNLDDDMHGKTGIYNGDFVHTDGIIKSLVVFKDENNRNINFYALPDTIKLLTY